VSPHWYASPDQVPTWLYQAVHLSGPVRTMSGHELGQHLEALSAKFEGWLAPKPSCRRRDNGGAARGDDESDRGLVMTVEDIEAVSS